MDETGTGSGCRHDFVCGGEEQYGRGRGLRSLAAWSRSDGGAGLDADGPLISGEFTNAVRTWEYSGAAYAMSDSGWAERRIC